MKLMLSILCFIIWNSSSFAQTRMALVCNNAVISIVVAPSSPGTLSSLQGCQLVPDPTGVAIPGGMFDGTNFTDPTYATNTTVGRPQWNEILLTNVASANSAAVIPKNSFIAFIIVQNKTANAITGGIKFGTTSGASDIANGVAVGANALISVSDTALVKRAFSTTLPQTVFIDAVTAWNAANLNVLIVYGTL